MYHAPLQVLDHLHEVVKQVMRIVRAGRRFGMILHAEHRLAAMPEAFQRLIVQIDVREIHFVQVQRIRIHREAVIVRRDLHLLGHVVQHRMIRAAVPELELVGLAAERQAENLMAQADAEDRFLADQFADLLRLELERLGIARPVREKHAVRLERQHVFGRCAAPEPRSRARPPAPAAAGYCA